jgi:hypothetical protein
MVDKYHIIGLAIFASLPSLLLADDQTDHVPGVQASMEAARRDGDLFELADSLEKFVSAARTEYSTQQRDHVGAGTGAFYPTETLFRAGWWFTDVRGSPTKIGEYQDLQPSPFWDLNHFHSDGVRTRGVSVTGLDLEGTDVQLSYFGPRLDANVEYQRFLRRLDHDPLLDWPKLSDTPSPVIGQPEGSGLVAEDLNVGEDYAIRVQELKADFKGRLSDKVRWRLNVWGMRRSGERQANALSNCFDHPDIPGSDRGCHVLSRRQEIDWVTMQIEPVLETRSGPVTVTFSLPVRSFSQNDQHLTRLYNAQPAILAGQAIPPQLGSESYPAGSYYPYAVVPENVTQMRKLKIGADLMPRTHLYGLLYDGLTDNSRRNTHRRFDGFDLRLTDRSFDNFTLTGYAKIKREENELPEDLISGEELEFDRYDETEIPCLVDDGWEYGGCGCEPVVSPCVVGADGVSDFFARDAIVHPIDYRRTSAGVNGRWVPFRRHRSWVRGLAFYGGYEYRRLRREYAEFRAALSTETVGIYDQSDTRSHQFRLGVTQRWSPALDTFVRYRTRFDADPLFGVRENNGLTNTNLPTEQDLIEIGGTWSPAHRFLASATFGIESRRHRSDVADFDEDDYPLAVTLWHAPTQDLSLSAGYAYNSNWIDQAIALGDELRDAEADAPVTRTWRYGGRSHVGSLGGTYVWAPGLRLRGNVQYVRGNNAIDSTVFDDPYVWPEIAEVTQDVIELVRISAGFDYLLNRGFTSYFRYNFFDYEDELRTYNSGTANMFLAGLSGVY